MDELKSWPEKDSGRRRSNQTRAPVASVVDSTQTLRSLVAAASRKERDSESAHTDFPEVLHLQNAEKGLWRGRPHIYDIVRTDRVFPPSLMLNHPHPSSVWKSAPAGFEI